MEAAAMRARVWSYYLSNTKDRLSELWRRKALKPKRASSTDRSELPTPLSVIYEKSAGISLKAPNKSSDKRRQNIHIEYDGIGFIPLEELAKKETA